MSDLKVRIISAVIAVSILSVILFYAGQMGLIVLVALVATGCQWEYFKMNLNHYPRGPWVMFYILSCAAIQIINVVRPEFLAHFIAVSFLVCFTSAMAQCKNEEDRTGLQVLIANLCMGLIYVALLPSFAYKLILKPDGIKILILCIFSVFACDTFAYFFGVRFGKNGRKLHSILSPKKSWAGSLGGIIGSLLFCVGLGSYWFADKPIYDLIILAILSAIFSQAGDLFESMLKRNANIKDSGRIMPGHGGFLDRVDGVFFALPIFYLFFR